MSIIRREFAACPLLQCNIIAGMSFVKELNKTSGETTLIGSRNALEEDFRHVMACLADGRVPVEALATHSTTLAKAVEDLPVCAADRGTVVRR